MVFRKLKFPDAYEIDINGKLIFSRRQLGEYPDTAEIVEISKWGNKVRPAVGRGPADRIALQGKSFLHMYLCSVAEGGEQRMVITDRKNTPLPKRVIMMCSVM